MVETENLRRVPCRPSSFRFRIFEFPYHARLHPDRPHLRRVADGVGAFRRPRRAQGSQPRESHAHPRESHAGRDMLLPSRSYGACWSAVVCGYKHHAPDGAAAKAGASESKLRRSAMFIATPIPKNLKPQRGGMSHHAPTELGFVRLARCYNHRGPPGLSPTADANAQPPHSEAVGATGCLTA
jgi:hypothetical protein